MAFTFGAEVVAQFPHRHGVGGICKAHQGVEGGYEFFAKRPLVYLFSAPDYCEELDNAGAIMNVDETLTNMLFLDFKACRGKEAKCHRTHNTSKGYDRKASKERDVILTLPSWDW